MRSTITKIANYLPSTVVTSTQIEEIVRNQGINIPRNILEQKFGISERRYADSNTQASDLAVGAAKKILQNIDKTTVDCLIFAAGSSDLIEPATANIVQAKLKLFCPTFDVKNACNSFVNALQLADSLIKLSTEEVQVSVIYKAVGQISESDVMLASASDAIIIGFQVRPSPQARKLAESESIDIRMYSIIYNAIGEIKSAIEGMHTPKMEEKITGNIEIREVFKITKVGAVAGCMVTDGKVFRNSKIRIIRDGVVVHTGLLSSLKRFKDDVKEVAYGFDCGLTIEKFNDMKVGDFIEAYEEVEIKRPAIK